MYLENVRKYTKDMRQYFLVRPRAQNCIATPLL